MKITFLGVLAVVAVVLVIVIVYQHSHQTGGSEGIGNDENATN